MKKLRLNVFRLLFIAYSILIIVSCNEKKQFDGYLYPIRENGLYGYIDSVGNRIIEPEFLWVSTFHNGLAMAVVDTIYRIVPDSMAYEVGERDTVINMYRMYVKYGYIDKTGKFLIKPTFVCYISMPQNGFHVNDLQECSNALYTHVFQNNRALFSDTITWKNGYIDKNGNIVIFPKYYYSDPFFNGKAIVMLPKGEQLLLNDWIITRGKLRSAYIDTTGNAITDFKYEKLTRFNGRRGIGSYKEIFSNVAGINDSFTEHNYIIDENGTEIKDLGFWNQFYGFSKDGIGLARQVMRLQVSDGMPDSYSFVDEKGHYLEPLKGLSEYQLDSISKCEDIIQVLPEDAEISHATHFNEGFAGISPDGKHWFVIDRYLLIHGYGEESVFEKFKVFNNGLAAVKKNGKWGYINKQIREQIPCKYDSCGLAYPFLEEIFEYDIQGNIKKVAYINRNDSLIWESLIPKPKDISNEYSTKEKKDWGKWTYKYTDSNRISAWILLGGMFLVVVIVWYVTIKDVRIRRKKIEEKNELAIEGGNNPLDKSNCRIIISDEYEDDDIRFYPSVGQYTETIQLATSSPEDYFKELCNLHPVLDANGDPIMSNGNFAVVYKMVDDNGKFHAVRCFHRYQEGRRKSYKLICEELNKVSSPYLSPIKYFENEFYIDSVEYPVLLMDWVDGIPLDKYIRKIINDKTKLRSLAENFHQLAIWLLNQPFAHGDLKPDNILVKKDGSLVLVDYDGMFVPAMEGQKARELGSPDFRNPIRTETDFDKNIDTFPIISILLSLELLVENKDYLSKYGEEDRLLFSEDDYRNIDNNVLFRIALSSYNDDISELAANLKLQLSKIQDNNIIPLLNMKEIRYKQEQKNEIIEKSLTFIILLYSLLVPLGTYLYIHFTPETDWNSLGVSAGILCTAIFLYFVMLIIDLFRPYKKYHLFINEDYTSFGCVFSLWDIFIAIGLILNSLINCVWYITLLIIIIWICFFYVLGGITYGAFELRTCIYKTPTEKRIEVEAKERDKIRTNLRIEEEQRQKKLEKNEVQRELYNNDDLPF